MQQCTLAIESIQNVQTHVKDLQKKLFKHVRKQSHRNIRYGYFEIPSAF